MAVGESGSDLPERAMLISDRCHGPNLRLFTHPLKRRVDTTAATPWESAPRMAAEPVSVSIHLAVNVVREIRERSGLTTSELARRAATSRPNVTAYEHDRQQPPGPSSTPCPAAGCAISVTGPVRRPETERSRRLGIAVAAKLVADPDAVSPRGAPG